MEAKYAPPDHPVFERTPPDFHSLASKHYDAMGQPLVTSKSFWTVYQDLLSRFKEEKTTNPLKYATFTAFLSERDQATEKIDKEEIPLLPGLKALRAGGEVVGSGAGNESDAQSVCAEMTEDEEDEDNNENNDAPTFMVSMTSSNLSTSASASSTGHRTAPTFEASMTPTV